MKKDFNLPSILANNLQNNRDFDDSLFPVHLNTAF